MNPEFTARLNCLGGPATDSSGVAGVGLQNLNSAGSVTRTLVGSHATVCAYQVHAVIFVATFRILPTIPALKRPNPLGVAIHSHATKSGLYTSSPTC